MQVTSEKPKKVLMGSWEYVVDCAFFYLIGYSNGRFGWATHNFGWVYVPALLLLMAAPFIDPRYRQSLHN